MKYGYLIAGIILGSVATLYFLKKKNGEEVWVLEDAKNDLENPKEVVEETMEKVKDDKNIKPNIMEYAKILNAEHYVDYSDKKEPKNQITIISPEEVPDNSEYDTFPLIYYSDGVLANDDDEIIFDVEARIGDALNHFDEFEKDIVCVKNDIRKCYYEISRDYRSFEEVSGTKPPQVTIK